MILDDNAGPGQVYGVRQLVRADTAPRPLSAFLGAPPAFSKCSERPE